MSLHTKYRPKTFDDVLGQDHVISGLKQVVKNRRAKTFLFCGPSGTGKTTLARLLTNAVAGTALEVPAADHTGVEDMRDIIAASHRRALGASPVKSIILDEAHRLSGQAWDALLKATEEPPSHVYWMFCTTNQGKIPKTMQTRCVTYTLKPVREELIFTLLDAVAQAEKMEVNDEVLEAIAEEAGGSPRQALVFLEACASSKTAPAARAIMQSGARSPEAVDLGRWLVGGRGICWAEAIRRVKALEGFDAESIRISLVNYIQVILLNTSGEQKARKLLALQECFLKPYNQSDRMAPLLHSLGQAVGLDQ